jgi:hypothetical protein
MADQRGRRARQFPARVATLLLLLAVLATRAQAAQDTNHLAKLYHTLGGRETLLGHLEARPGGGVAVAVAPDAASDLPLLRSAVASGAPYSLRLSSRLGVPEGGRARHVVTSVPAACAPQLLLPPSPLVLLLHASAAGSPVALEVEAAGGGGQGALACDRAAALRQLESHGDGGGFVPELSVQVVAPAVAPPVPITTLAPGQAAQQQQQAAAAAAAQQQQQQGANGTAGNGTAGGRGPPPKDERTFFQKNGLFIVGGAMMVLNVLLRPEPAATAPRAGGGGGGGGGGRGAPARRQ